MTVHSEVLTHWFLGWQYTKPSPTLLFHVQGIPSGPQLGQGLTCLTWVRLRHSSLPQILPNMTLGGVGYSFGNLTLAFMKLSGSLPQIPGGCHRIWGASPGRAPCTCPAQSGNSGKDELLVLQLLCLENGCVTFCISLGESSEISKATQSYQIPTCCWCLENVLCRESVLVLQMEAVRGALALSPFHFQHFP